MGAKDGPHEAPEASDPGEKGFATLNSLRYGCSSRKVELFEIRVLHNGICPFKTLFY